MCNQRLVITSHTNDKLIRLRCDSEGHHESKKREKTYQGKSNINNTTTKFKTDQITHDVFSLYFVFTTVITNKHCHFLFKKLLCC